MNIPIKINPEMNGLLLLEPITDVFIKNNYKWFKCNNIHVMNTYSDISQTKILNSYSYIYLRINYDSMAYSEIEHSLSSIQFNYNNGKMSGYDSVNNIHYEYIIENNKIIKIIANDKIYEYTYKNDNVHLK